MDELALQDVGDRHLNLFYTYGHAEWENNVTRGLMLTLSQLAPVHLRLFLHDVVLAEPRSVAQKVLRDRLRLLAEPDFRFELQARPDDERDPPVGSGNSGR